MARDSMKSRSRCSAFGSQGTDAAEEKERGGDAKGGGGGPPPCLLRYPRGLAVDRDSGWAFVADSQNHRVAAISDLDAMFT